MIQVSQRIVNAVKSGLLKAKQTIFWLIKLVLPISFLVSLLQYSGILGSVSVILNPVFQMIGLPGSASIAFVCSIFMPLYAPAAIVSTIGLTVRQMTIMAIMCLISHNTFVETAVQKKTGSSYLFILFLRYSMSFIAAFIWNAMLPADLGSASHIIESNVAELNMSQALLFWAEGAVRLCIKMSLIVTALMILQRLLEEFHIMDALARFFAPVMRFMGLSKDCSFMWLVANTLGITYGGAILVDQVHEGKLAINDVRMLNIHLAISHSLLEDTSVFVVIGVPVFWVTVPRILLAVLVVWIIRITLFFCHPKPDSNKNGRFFEKTPVNIR